VCIKVYSQWPHILMARLVCFANCVNTIGIYRKFKIALLNVYFYTTYAQIISVKLILKLLRCCFDVNTPSSGGLLVLLAKVVNY
jgi:hypothetical protein